MPPKSMKHPGLELPRVPILGTTWYCRSAGYWYRRTLYFLVAVAVSFFPFWIVGIVFDLIARDTHSWTRVILLIAATACVCVSLFFGFRSFAQTKHEEKMLLEGRNVAEHPAGSGRVGGSIGIGLGVAARGGSVLAGGLIVFGQLLVIGYLVPLFFRSFGRYVGPPEIRAIISVREWYELHPEIPNYQRPKQFRI